MKASGMDLAAKLSGLLNQMAALADSITEPVNGELLEPDEKDALEVSAEQAHVLKVRLLALLDHIDHSGWKYARRIEPLEFSANRRYHDGALSWWIKLPNEGALRAAIEILQPLERKLQGPQDGKPLAATRDNETRRSKVGRPRERDHAQVAGIVAQFPEWKKRLDEVAEALDKANVPLPKKWRSKDAMLKCWDDVLVDAAGRTKVRRCIEDSLRFARNSGVDFPGNTTN